MQVLYDAPATDSDGRTHAEGIVYVEMTRELLERVLKPKGYTFRAFDIRSYRSGQIGECRFTIYMGSFYQNRVPEPFLNDFVNASETRDWVLWAGYNIWQLGPALETTFGFRYVALTTVDPIRRDEAGRPTFFQLIESGSRRFVKYADWNSRGLFEGATEMIELAPVDALKSEVRAEAVHSGTGKALPYLLRSGTRYYLADNPFAYVDDPARDRTSILRDEVLRALEAQGP